MPEIKNEEQPVAEVVVDEDEAQIILRNEEQKRMIDALVSLRATCNDVIDTIETEWGENESLYGQPVDWDTFTCLKSERFLDSEGAVAWRVYCAGISPNATKLLTALRDKLVVAGWEPVEVTTAC